MFAIVTLVQRVSIMPCEYKPLTCTQAGQALNCLAKPLSVWNLQPCMENASNQSVPAPDGRLALLITKMDPPQPEMYALRALLETMQLDELE